MKPSAALLSLFCLTALCPAETAIDKDWRILAGADPLERTAAADTAVELQRRLGVALAVVGNAKTLRGPSLIIGTAATNPLVAAEHARAPFDLPGDSPERYHLAFRDGSLYAVGATPKGAMNAVFRFLDRGALRVDTINEALSPALRYRVAGHLMNQRPPSDWSEDDQARYYARHYINVVWGEKHGPPLSAAAREKYGLGLMLELRIPFAVPKEWWDDRKNAGAAYHLGSTDKSADKRRCVDPFDPAGRAWYLESYKNLIRDNPGLKIIYAIFGDYNYIPGPDSVRISDGKKYTHTRAGTMLEILHIMKEAIGDRPIVPRAWTWHGFYGRHEERRAFMRELPAHGYGAMYNEAGDDDCWVIKLDNFDADALAAGPDGKSLYGPDYLSLVAVGGACESVKPAIGMPLPRVAAYKLGRLAAAGVRDIALWWGSGEGWLYQSNLAVLAELTWAGDAARCGNSKDFAAAEPLLRRIAARDFGPELAPKIVQFWKLYDEALVTDWPRYKKATVENYGDPARDGLRIYDWYQRHGVYASWPFGNAILKPVTPDDLAGFKYGGWGANDYAAANFKAVLDKLAAAQDYLARVIAEAPASAAYARAQLATTAQWTKLFYLILESQWHHIRAVQIMRHHKDAPANSPQLRAALEPLAKESVASTAALIRHAETFPKTFSIMAAHRDVHFGRTDRDKDIAKIAAKLQKTRNWLDGVAAPAKNTGAPAAAVVTLPGGATRKLSDHPDTTPLEAETLVKNTPPDATAPWEIVPDENASGGALVMLNATEKRQYIIIKTPVVKGVKYRVLVGTKRVDKGGAYALYVNKNSAPAGGEKNGAFNPPQPVYEERDHGEVTFTKVPTDGLVDFKLASMFPGLPGGGYKLAIDYIKLVPIK
ncbi:MAG: hypothetical protein LBI02_05820 [Opitutaceae bacterium]|jgi:predicted cupin superfamily sugar epimerase|nr:hypothetical protein [Opitutaceae bacterium]